MDLDFDWLEDFIARSLARLKVLAAKQADWILAKLLEGISKGWGFEKLGKAIVDALGLGLADALRWARTVQMAAYRTEGRKYREQVDFIDGWVWFAQLDERTCTGPGSCSEQHGTFHTNNESINELTLHIWNCRCTELDHVRGDPNPITGEPIEE